MRQADFSGVIPRKKGRTTFRGPGARPAPDLVGRDFTASERNRLWAADLRSEGE